MTTTIATAAATSAADGGISDNLNSSKPSGSVTASVSDTPLGIVATQIII